MEKNCTALRVCPCFLRITTLLINIFIAVKPAGEGDLKSAGPGACLFLRVQSCTVNSFFFIEEEVLLLSNIRLI